MGLCSTHALPNYELLGSTRSFHKTHRSKLGSFNVPAVRRVIQNHRSTSTSTLQILFVQVVLDTTLEQLSAWPPPDMKPDAHRSAVEGSSIEASNAMVSTSQLLISPAQAQLCHARPRSCPNWRTAQLPTSPAQAQLRHARRRSRPNWIK